jgi:hypothetical protein
MSGIKKVVQLIEQSGGKVHEVCGPLPDGSGFMLASFPLPKDHWIYQEEEGVRKSPAPFLRGTSDPERKDWERKISEAARYAIRGATLRGKDMDFDPDALVQNMIVGMLGLFTPDGTSSTSCESVRVIDDLCSYAGRRCEDEENGT